MELRENVSFYDVNYIKRINIKIVMYHFFQIFSAVFLPNII